MKEEKYIRDITEIRSMMEKTSKFMSISGRAGIWAGLFAIAGALTAYYVFGFNPDSLYYEGAAWSDHSEAFILALGVLVLATSTFLILTAKKANERGERLWGPTARRLAASMAAPLISGILLIIILISNGLIGLVVPLSLIFYGLALFNASAHTFKEIKLLGILEIALGLIACCFLMYGLLIWTLGFGLLHIGYGIYVYNRYEK